MREQLLEIQGELVDQIQRLRGGVTIETGGDDLDRMLAFSGREQAAKDLERLVRRLGEVEAALKKAPWELGVCEECGEDIGPKRRAARPEARLCIQCAEERERRER